MKQQELEKTKEYKYGFTTDIESIKAPLLPLCPINPVVSEYNSINETAPVELSAALCTTAFLGRKLDISTPIPPPASARLLPP